MIKDLHLRLEIVKFFKDNIEENPFGNDFLDITLKNKHKDQQVGLCETKSLCTAKENHQNKKETYEMGQNICQPYIQIRG